VAPLQHISAADERAVPTLQEARQRADYIEVGEEESGDGEEESRRA
jgi:hypothetical protein